MLWVHTDDYASYVEGWGVFEDVRAPEESKRRWLLQKRDESDKFKSDDDVWLHVWRRGCMSQQSLEGRALQYLLENSPEEYKEIAVYGWRKDQRAA